MAVRYLMLPERATLSCPCLPWRLQHVHLCAMLPCLPMSGQASSSENSERRRLRPANCSPPCEISAKSLFGRDCFRTPTESIRRLRVVRARQCRARTANYFAAGTILWWRKTQRLVGPLDPQAHFLILSKFDGILRLGKRGISAQLDDHYNSAAAFGRHFSRLNSKTLDRTVITFRPPERQKIFKLEAGIRVPNFVALLHISRDDGIHEPIYGALLRRESQKIPQCSRQH